jgi:hypothetical protein
MWQKVLFHSLHLLPSHRILCGGAGRENNNNNTTLAFAVFLPIIIHHGTYEMEK